jgi:chaperonin cofactor prefoldin
MFERSTEVFQLPRTQQNSIQDLVSQARERLNQELKAQAAQLQKMEESLQELRAKHQQVEAAIQEQLEALGKAEPASDASTPTADSSLEKVLGAVRNLITATFPEQVHDVLTEEAEQLGVRAAVFDVRGKAAWGASARGFSSGLSEKTFRALVVPLTQDNPFRHCYETAGSVDTTPDHLAKNRNVLDKLRPESGDSVILLPIRSAGSVSAIFYADTGGSKKELPVDALKILAEFAGAQLDRLMALSGGLPSQAAEAVSETVEAVGEVEAEAPVETVEVEPVDSDAGAPTAEPEAPAAEEFEAAPAAEPTPPPPPAGFDIAQLSEADQKLHRDAKRFARLLVSEIELYNKGKVADGRKNKDLYTRLKSDIVRSRQTYAKRFGKTVASQQDYFHEEVLKTLAANDPSVLGSDYPGPSA